jgi:hypothetical protein
MAYIAILALLTTLVSGGLSYEAQKAYPGDPLYVYKIEVNERVEAWLSQSNHAKAQYDLAMLHERLDEAKYLAAHGKLTPGAQTEVTENITVHVKNLTALFEKLQQEGSNDEAATLAVQLFHTLNDETATIADLSAQGSTNEQLSLAPVLVKLRTTLVTVALLSGKIQARAAGIEARTNHANANSASATLGL